MLRTYLFEVPAYISLEVSADSETSARATAKEWQEEASAGAFSTSLTIYGGRATAWIIPTKRVVLRDSFVEEAGA